MIQRKQSIYLFLILCIIAFLLGSNPVMLTLSGEPSWYEAGLATIEVSILKIDRIIGGQSDFFTWNSYLIYGLAATGLLAFLSLFLYKNRKLQLLLCGFNYLFMAGTGVLMYFYMEEGKSWFLVTNQSDLHYSFFIAIVLPVFNFLAMRGIFSDEKLIRSMDRLR